MCLSVDYIRKGDVRREDLACVRLAALLHDIGKPAACQWDEEKRTAHYYGHPKESVKIAKQMFSSSIRLTGKMKADVLMLISRHEDRRYAVPDPKKLLGKIGYQKTKMLFALWKADIKAHGRPCAECRKELLKELDEIGCYEKEADEASDRGDAVSVKDLAVCGDDLILSGMKPGPAFSYILSSLTDMVIKKRIRNEKQELLSAAEEIYCCLDKDSYKSKEGCSN